MVFRRSRTPLEADWYFEGLEVLYRRTTVSLEEVDRVISKAQNSNSKQTKVQMKPELYSKMKDILRSKKLGVLLIPISKVCSFLERYETLKVYSFWTSSWTRFQRLTTLSRLSFLIKMLTLLWFCDFKDLEPLLRQTSYLKAHGFPDANKRWGRIKVGSSKRKVEKRQRKEPPKLDFEGSQLSRRFLMEF
ncbi:hypothetical protein RclHR1_26280001 [Rhizophagus clarus]|uniref:Uncharacterized protein n=1 Tax=Rhizophagus clarus TaxID=94130 RepID=A0A2Z6RE50_9GLOM|nr:hypothetical protein RclHR1_26280001 [Rhizophagus clarus]